MKSVLISEPWKESQSISNLVNDIDYNFKQYGEMFLILCSNIIKPDDKIQKITSIWTLPQIYESKDPMTKLMAIVL